MNALLVVDKPAGMTSHDVVSVVRRATGERAVGHLGTLDPMATGVLPLLLGRYTRLAQFFGAAAKQYTGTIRFGWRTDSFDADGVTCMSCHAIQSGDTRGTGSYVLGIPAVLLDENGQPIRRPVSDGEILAHLGC